MLVIIISAKVMEQLPKGFLNLSVEDMMAAVKSLVQLPMIMLVKAKDIKIQKHANFVD